MMMKMKMNLMLFVVGAIPSTLMQWLVRWRFNTVQQQTPVAVARRLNSEPVLLLDVRTRDEFDAEHLESAIHVNDAEGAQQVIRDFRMNTSNGQVIAYCTVGYRSSQFAAHMASVGCVHIDNLEGGIWAWAAAGLPKRKATA